MVARVESGTESEKYFGSSLVFRLLFQRSLFRIVFFFSLFLVLSITNDVAARPRAYLDAPSIYIYVYITYVCTRYLPATQRQGGQRWAGKSNWKRKVWVRPIPSNVVRRDGTNMSACCLLLMLIVVLDVVIVDAVVVVVVVLVHVIVIVVDVVPVAVIVVIVVVRLLISVFTWRISSF